MPAGYTAYWTSGHAPSPHRQRLALGGGAAAALGTPDLYGASRSYQGALGRRHCSGWPRSGGRAVQRWDLRGRGPAWTTCWSSTRRATGPRHGPYVKHWGLRHRWSRRGIDIRRQWRHDIPRIRAEVVDEVKAMIEESAEETAAWMARRKSWVRATYSTPDKPARTQVLVFLELLRLLGYPDVQALEEDMTDGFQMIGDIRPGPGWRLREDGRHQKYVRKKIGARRSGEFDDQLLHAGTRGGKTPWPRPRTDEGACVAGRPGGGDPGSARRGHPRGAPARRALPGRRAKGQESRGLATVLPQCDGQGTRRANPPLHRQLRGPGPTHGGGDARPDRLRPRTRTGSGRSECRRNAARSWAHDTASPFGTTSP